MSLGYIYNRQTRLNLRNTQLLNQMNTMRKLVTLFFLLGFLSISTFAQNGLSISGRVTDKDTGEELIGATVSIKGTTNATITDIDGRYTINVPSKNATLVFDYLGYQKLEKAVTAPGTVNIEMSSSNVLLEEVVAIGYGTMKKSDLTGSVASVSGETLRQMPVSGVDQALQGRVAGVTVNSNSGQPGARADIRIRGIGTVLADASPLFVVDGVMVDNIDFLSPSDIQSTEVLKDASATAIYGSRGANGVILVTTKKGSSSGAANISYETYFGWQNRWKKLDLMNRDQFAYTRSLLDNYFVNGQTIDPVLAKYYETGDQASFNQWMEDNLIGGQIYFPMARTQSNPNGFNYAGVDTDWQDAVFRSNAAMQNHYLSVDGGNEKSTYAISANHFKQDGTLIGSWYKRLTVRANSSHKVTNWLRVGENLSFTTSSNQNAANNSLNASVLTSAVSMAPWDPTHYPEGAISYPGKDGSGNKYPKGRDLSGQISASSNFKNTYNPFTSVEAEFPKDKFERWVGDIYVELTPIKDLILRGDVSLDLSNGESSQSKLKYMYSSYDKNDDKFYSANMAKYRTIIYEGTANYTKKIGKHNFNVMAGATREDYNFHTVNGSGIPLDELDIKDWTLGKFVTYDPKKPSTMPGVGEGYDLHRRISFLGRAFYSYNDKYLATVTIRRDGSSKFPKEKMWATFPSLSLAWRASEEPFLASLKNTFDMVKFRAGWGRIGNDKLGNNEFMPIMTISKDVFTGYPFGQQLQTGASLLKYPAMGQWETSEQWNLGVDFSSANGHFYGTVDAFIRDTKDMLLVTEHPGHVGYRTNIITNVGTMRNKGLEFMLEYRNKLGAFNYSLSGNATLIDNKLTKLNQGEKDFDANKFQLTNEGLPVRTFWVYKYEGIFQSQAEIDNYYSYITDPEVKAEIDRTIGVGSAIYADLNKDGKIDNNDKMNLGNPFPWLTYGFNINLDYKAFDLKLFFQGVTGNEIMNAMRKERTEGNGLTGTLSTSMTDMWTPENPSGSIPNPLIQNNLEYSSRFIEDGSYFRLKNVQLGYTLPKKLLSHAGIKGLRVYAAVTNLFTLTNYTGYDPEVGVNGVDYGNYPQSRTFTVGAKFNF